MDPQRYLIAKIEPEMNETGRFPWLKFISETSMLKVESYPALLIEDEKPYGTEDMAGDGTYMTRVGEYTISLIVATDNLKDMTRENYRAAKKLAVGYVEELQGFIAECWHASASLEEDGVTVTVVTLSIGKADLGWLEIDSQPALVMQMPVEAKYVIS